MSLNTAKGVPHPAYTDPDDVPGDLLALANWIDAHPGIAAHTTAERNALVAPDLWPGVIIFNTTTGQLEQNVSGTAGSANWSALADPHILTSWTAWTPTVTNGTAGVCRYKQIGKTVFVRAVITPTGSSGWVWFTLPVPPMDTYHTLALQDSTGGTNTKTVAFVNTTPIQAEIIVTSGAANLSGAFMVVSGVYEAA